LVRFDSLCVCFVRLWIAWRMRSMRLPNAATGVLVATVILFL
jgi:hypothetical protein